MTIEFFKALLGWAMIINLSVLTIWFVLFLRCHDVLYKQHTKWFLLTQEQFNAIHYAGMAFYKINILFFNIAPFVAIQCIV